MSNSITYRSFSLLMAFLILFSSSGLTMDMHFCQGHLKRINLFGKAKTCAEVVKSCCHAKALKTACGINDDHVGCCNNTEVLLDMDIESTALISTDISNDNIIWLKAYVSIFLKNLYISGYHSYTDYAYLPPPDLKQNTVVLFQNFRL